MRLRLISLRFLDQPMAESLDFDLLHQYQESLTMIEGGAEKGRKFHWEYKPRRLEKDDAGSETLPKWPRIDHISAWVKRMHAMGGHWRRESLAAVQKKMNTLSDTEGNTTTHPKHNAAQGFSKLPHMTGSQRPTVPSWRPLLMALSRGTCKTILDICEISL